MLERVAANRASGVRGAGSGEVGGSDHEPTGSQVIEKGRVRGGVDRVPVREHNERKGTGRGGRSRVRRRRRERRGVIDGGDDRAARRGGVATPCRCRSRRVDEGLLRLPDDERSGDRRRGRRGRRDRRRVALSPAGRPALPAEDPGQSIRSDQPELPLLLGLRGRRRLRLRLRIAAAAAADGEQTHDEQHRDGGGSSHAASCHAVLRSVGL